MMQTPEDRRPPLTPQLALRVAIVGSVALAMFAIIFFRLWFLQVLSGDQYLAKASVNRVRTLAVPAARGQILDRDGHILVDSKPSIAVQLSPPDLPRTGAKRRRMYTRLAQVLGVPTKRRSCTIIGGPHVVHARLAPIACAVAQQHALLPYANVTIKTDVSDAVHGYLAERQDQFPGVSVEQVWLRRYPLHDLAAQLFGTVGPISRAELKQTRYRGVNQQSIVGQSGLEWYYDRYLRGRDGAERVQVDALGRFKGYLSERKPIAGHSLKLSLNLDLQKAGQQALSQAIANSPPAPAGAFVALNPVNGEVYAMGSSPTFDPNIFTKPLSESAYQKLNNASSGFPLFNRAIQSSYPTGSTFKGITATAALQSGAWNLGSIYDDTGVYQNGPGDTRHNAGHAAYGAVNLTQAIQVSSDNFFYNLGRLLNADPTKHPNGGALQQWARGFGIGRPTGIDLGGENSGILPSPKWRTGRDKLELAVRARHGPVQGQAPPYELRDRRRAPVVGRRQREPRGRPGRPGGHAAPARGRLLGARERRRRRAPPRRTRGRRAGRHRAPADRPAGVTPPADRLGQPRRDPGGPARRGVAVGRHLGGRVRRLGSEPLPGVWEDGNRSAHRAGRPIVVCVLRARPRPPDPRCRHRRAGRLRRPGGRPGRAPDPLAVVLRQARPVRRRELEDAVSVTTPIQVPEEASAPRARSLLRFDPLLMLAAAGLVACSLITLKGATRNAVKGHPLFYVERQAIYVGIGVLLAVLISRIDYSRLREYRYGFYGLLVALNIVVFGMPAIRGSHRWIPLPFFQVQSSEFGKILLIVSLAAFAVDRMRRLHELRTTARIMLFTLLPALIVIPQPDLGTGLVYVVVGFMMLVFAGTPGRQLAGLIAAFAAVVAFVLVGAPALGVHVLKPYQVQRLTGFVNPSRDPRNQTYNILQSEIAIGSGQKTGRGVAHATQTSLNYLPEHQTDFIFAAVGETYGFVGGALVLSLYALLIWRSLRILTLAKNLYGTLIAAGILAMLMFQVFVNVGMTIGIMPITGVPLPLMSYGGSSVLVTFIALGLLQSIHIQARIASAGKGRALIS